MVTELEKLSRCKTSIQKHPPQSPRTSKHEHKNKNESDGVWRWRIYMRCVLVQMFDGWILVNEKLIPNSNKEHNAMHRTHITNTAWSITMHQCRRMRPSMYGVHYAATHPSANRLNAHTAHSTAHSQHQQWQ